MPVTGVQTCALPIFGAYSFETKEYIAMLGRLNQRLADMADKVTEVVYGIPVPVKES